MNTYQDRQSQESTPLSHWNGDGGEASLISEVFQRRALLADIDHLIIADVRRQARRAWIRRWTRAVVFSFGLPLVLLLFAACAYLYIIERGTSTFTFLIMALPSLALLLSTHRVLEIFSPEEV